MNFRHQAVLAAKRLLYGSRGEPFIVEGKVLRYLPGTRPVRIKYNLSENANSRYDALQVELFCSQLRRGHSVLDIGAHAGQYSVLMAAMCGPTGRVTAFEPDPWARQLLLRNIKLNPTIKSPVVENLAVGEKNGSSILFSRRGNPQSSFARSAVGLTGDKPIVVEVSTVTIDSYLRDRKLPEPDWIKIDTEGAEIGILRGASDILRASTNIVCELHPYAWAELGGSFEELKDIVASAGRRLRYLDEDSESYGQAKYGAVLLERVAR